MFNWDLIFKHEQRMEELAIERLKLENEKLRLEIESAKLKGAQKRPDPAPPVVVSKGFEIDLHRKFGLAPYRRREAWGHRR